MEISVRAGLSGSGPVLSVPGVRGAVVGTPGPSRNVRGHLEFSGVGWSFDIGATSSGVTITISSELFLVVFFELNKLSQQRDIPETRDFAQYFRRLTVQHSRDRERLSIFQLNLSLQFARCQRRNRSAAYGQRIRVVERTDFRRKMQPDRSPRRERRREFQLDAKFAK